MYLSSWSGGKDSCLACYKAIKQGYKVSYLLNFISREHKRCCFHGIESRLLREQAEAIGISLVQREVSPDMDKYEQEFKAAVNDLKGRCLPNPSGRQRGLSSLKGMVFGDVYLDEHREWVARVCKELDIEPVEPLWNIPAEKVVEEFIDAGFKAVVVSAKADLFSEDFMGRVVDKDLFNELKARKICPCGENGEFHTLVVDGPIFKKRIEITKSQPVLKEGFWRHWFLDIQEWRINDK